MRKPRARHLCRARGPSKMPLFKFGFRKKIPRKSSSMGSLFKDYGGDAAAATDEAAGNKKPDAEHAGFVVQDANFRERKVSTSADPAVCDLERRLAKATRQNNLLKLKVEILLDMLAQKTAEADWQETQVLKMRNIMANS